LDQIPPLIHLKQCLYKMSLTDVSVVSKRPLIIEINTEVRHLQIIYKIKYKILKHFFLLDKILHFENV